MFINFVILSTTMPLRRNNSSVHFDLSNAKIGAKMRLPVSILYATEDATFNGFRKKIIHKLPQDSILVKKLCMVIGV